MSNDKDTDKDKSVAQLIEELALRAKAASADAAKATTAAKNRALLRAAELLEDRIDSVLEQNALDVEEAEKANLSEAFIDRLTLNLAGAKCMGESLRQVAALPDPVGAIEGMRPLPSGISVGKMTVPIGVIGIIYEARPGVTAEAASLCIKSGNACLLKGGKEAIRTNEAIARLFRQGLIDSGLNPDSALLIDSTDRAAVSAMLKQDRCIDVIIPRGGKGLIKTVMAETRIPVIKHLDGVCHVYIDEFADAEKAETIVINAKTQRYGTCNTMETLLVHAARLRDVMPNLAVRLSSLGVEIRGDERMMKLFGGALKPATEEDWSAEYLAPILSVKVVDSLDEAIAHINKYGSKHTDSIVSENASRIARFLREVDSSSVMANASTRFADGFEYGLGAEIGISTNKLHARGPVGLEGLTTYKWIVIGDGSARA